MVITSKTFGFVEVGNMHIDLNNIVSQDLNKLILDIFIVPKERAPVHIDYSLKRDKVYPSGKYVYCIIVVSIYFTYQM